MLFYFLFIFNLQILVTFLLISGWNIISKINNINILNKGCWKNKLFINLHLIFNQAKTNKLKLSTFLARDHQKNFFS